MMNKCCCNPGEINLACPIHGGTGQEAVGKMIQSGGDLDNETERRLNEDIKKTVKSISRMGDIKDRFTTILSFKDEDEQAMHSVWIKVGADKFCVTPIPIKTLDEAEWFRERVAVMLDRIVQEMK
jgi:hypothetical protein